MIGWLKFLGVELLALVLMVVGWFLLVPMAIFKCWHTAPSALAPYEDITIWNGGKFTWVWGNEEDGVTGPAWYLPGKPAWLRAYLWSAWRNSANNLRWLTAWKGGPFKRLTAGSWYVQFGFRPDNGWPVISAGSHPGPFDY